MVITARSYEVKASIIKGRLSSKKVGKKVKQNPGFCYKKRLPSNFGPLKGILKNPRLNKMDKRTAKLYVKKLRNEMTDVLSYLEKFADKESVQKSVSFLQDDLSCKSYYVNESSFIEDKAVNKINPAKLNEEDFTFDFYENGALCNLGALLDSINLIEM